MCPAICRSDLPDLRHRGIIVVLGGKFIPHWGEALAVATPRCVELDKMLALTGDLLQAGKLNGLGPGTSVSDPHTL